MICAERGTGVKEVRADAVPADSVRNKKIPMNICSGDILILIIGLLKNRGSETGPWAATFSSCTDIIHMPNRG